MGASGDLLDITGLLDSSEGYSGGNPFAANLGYLRFIAQGANTLVQWDIDGLASDNNSWRTLLILKNINAANLAAENFFPYIPLDGSTAGLNLLGTPDNDRLDGSVLNDTMAGLDGSDILYGYAGNDKLDGGAGYDQLYGGQGNDVLTSGDLSDTAGGYLDGGSGNDTLNGTTANETFEGYYGSDIINGGEGNDTIGDFEYDSVQTTNTINAGGGNDLIRVFSYNLDSLAKITTGAGVDTIEFNASARGRHWSTILP